MVSKKRYKKNTKGKSRKVMKGGNYNNDEKQQLEDFGFTNQQISKINIFNKVLPVDLIQSFEYTPKQIIVATEIMNSILAHNNINIDELNTFIINHDVEGIPDEEEEEEEVEPGIPDEDEDAEVGNLNNLDNGFIQEDNEDTDVESDDENENENVFDGGSKIKTRKKSKKIKRKTRKSKK
jgi:hypothetical protein